MTTRTAPFRHADGTNCWTKNCSRGNLSAQTYDLAQKEKDLREKISTPTTAAPVYLDVIATPEEFAQAVANNEITQGRHPDYPYSIYKYSQSTTYSKNWNDVTRASRGLIVDNETNEILARPFGKFFNYSEHATPPELMTGPITVSEKLDGSLGISYPTPDGLQISTAGGFQSPQAEHATAIYRERYEGNWKPRKGVTYLWEIIYPENRIVVNYGEEDDIHLLGAVNIRTGKSIPLSELKEWKWKKATEYSNLSSIDSVVNSPERSNHEGYIVHFTDTDTRVKFKHEEYLRHHRYATGINSRRIWEMLRDGDNMDDWMKNAPEEFEEYITTNRNSIQGQFDTEVTRVTSSYNDFVKTLPADVSQKDFAMAVNQKVQKEDRGFFFTLRNTGNLETPSVKKSLWDRVKPEFEKSFWSANNGVEK